MTKWTLNSWNSSLSPQSVTLAPCIFRTHSKGALWDTDLTQSTWIDFISHSALFRGSQWCAVETWNKTESPWLNLSSSPGLWLTPVSTLWMASVSSFIPAYSSIYSHLSPMSFPWHFLPQKVNNRSCGCEWWPGSAGDRKVSLHTDLLTGQEPPLEQVPVEMQKTLGLTDCNYEFWEVKRSTFWMDTQDS